MTVLVASHTGVVNQIVFTRVHKIHAEIIVGGADVVDQIVTP